MNLRARKQASTRQRLQAAALHVVLRDGFENARIGDICERADVAKRTFFNYFDCKEDAVVGFRPPLADEKVLSSHARRYATASTTRSIIGLLLMILNQPAPYDPDGSQRDAVIRENPALLEWQLTQISKTTGAHRNFVKDVLRQVLPPDESLIEDMIDMIVISCAGALSAAIRKQIAGTGPFRLDDIENDANTILRRAADLLGE